MIQAFRLRVSGQGSLKIEVTTGPKRWSDPASEYLVVEFITKKSVHFQFYKGSYYPKKFNVH